MITRGMALAHGVPIVLTDREVCFNQDLRALVPYRDFDPLFLYYALIGAKWRFNPHIDRAAHGTARLIESAFLERIWAPRLGEQREIAAFLDAETARLRSLIGSRLESTGLLGRLVKLLDEYQAALITEVTTGQRQVVGKRDGRTEDWIVAPALDRPAEVTP
jgi:hypothetical protein